MDGEQNHHNENIVIKREVFDDYKPPGQFVVKESIVKIEPKREDFETINVKTEIDEIECKPKLSREVPSISTNEIDKIISKMNTQINPRKRTRPRKRYRKTKFYKLDRYNLDGVISNVKKDFNAAESSTRENETLRIKSEDRVYQCNSSSDEESDEYVLSVTNLPKSWSIIQIKNYIDTACGPVDEIEVVQSNTEFGTIRLFFPSGDACRTAMTKLTDKEIDGTKLTLEMKVIKDSEPPENKELNSEEKPSCSYTDVWDEDPKGLYGMRPQFLYSLSIQPPLEKWVNVSNFRCDKSELRDVMELAGQVLLCTVITVANRYANVMYSHPLEAVQAVSMLNGQIFYGQSLKVVMTKCPNDTTVLPKGLATIGPGLGKKGRPLRNIVKQYKRHLKRQNSQINPLMFSEFGENSPNNGTETQNPTQDLTEALDRSESQSENASFRDKNIEESNNVGLDNDGKDSSDGVAGTSTDNTNKPNSPNLKVNASNQSNSKDNSMHSKTTNVISNNQSLSNADLDKSKTSTEVAIPSTSGSGQTSGPSTPWSHFGSITSSGLSRPSIAQNAVFQTRPEPFLSNCNPGDFWMRPKGPGNGPVWPTLPFGPRPEMRPIAPGPHMGPIAPGPQTGPIAPGPQMGPIAPGPQMGPIGPRPQMEPIGSRPQMGPMGPRPQMEPSGSRPQMGPFGSTPQIDHGATMRPDVTQLMGFTNVRLSNLPLSIAFNFLCDKLSQFGQVMSLQFLAPGCAIAGFANHAHAERCIQQLNRFQVEGRALDVKFA